MVESPATKRTRAKLGPMVGGAVLTVNATPDTVEDLEPGHYTIEPSAAMYVLQCTEAELATADATDGVLCPANVETEFGVDEVDGFLIFVRVSADGTARLNRRDRAQGTF